MSAAAKGSEIWATMPHSSGDSRGLCSASMQYHLPGCGQCTLGLPCFSAFPLPLPAVPVCTVFPGNSYSSP